MKVLLIDEVHPIFTDKLSSAKIEFDYLPNLTNDQVLNIIPSYDGIVLRSKILANKEFIDKGSKLKFIGRVGAGMETVDIDYAEMKGIRCLNSPEGNRDAVAEQVIGMLLSLMNNLRKADSEVRSKIWNREGNRGHEIKGKTVGIIGYGYMGSALAEKLQGFSANVIAYDKYKLNFSSPFVKEVTLETLFKTSDIVSIHVPQTDETIGMVNDIFINSFHKPIYLINTARGKVVETQAVKNGIESGKIIGAALDVLEYESYNFENFLKEDMPEAFNFITNSAKVILTPHIAGWTFESKLKLSEILADKIIDLHNLLEK